jgi:hypothetical protein
MAGVVQCARTVVTLLIHSQEITRGYLFWSAEFMPPGVSFLRVNEAADLMFGQDPTFGHPIPMVLEVRWRSNLTGMLGAIRRQHPVSIHQKAITTPIPAALPQ